MNGQMHYAMFLRESNCACVRCDQCEKYQPDECAECGGSGVIEECYECQQARDVGNHPAIPDSSGGNDGR